MFSLNPGYHVNRQHEYDNIASVDNKYAPARALARIDLASFSCYLIRILVQAQFCIDSTILICITVALVLHNNIKVIQAAQKPCE